MAELQSSPGTILPPVSSGNCSVRGEKLNDTVYSKETSSVRHSKKVIYDCYKPVDIEETKEYIEFILTHRSILPNEIEDSIEPVLNENAEADISFNDPPPNLSPKLRNYLKEVAERRKRLEQHLWFDSNFECGNLSKAAISKDNKYILYLSSDTNAPDMSQWFYFSVENTRQLQTVQFTIMNVIKFSALYAEGIMKPMVFSEIDYKASHTTWSSDDIDTCSLTEQSPVSSYGSRMVLPYSKGKLQVLPSVSYSLSFAYTFKYSNDRVYFAFGRPYTLGRLRRQFCRLESALFQKSVTATCDYINSHPETRIKTKTLIYKHVQLCASSGGIPVDCVTVSGLESRSARWYVVITARVHASETPSSFKAESILHYLLGSHELANELRSLCTFIVVPMLNPDGVALGNTRYSLEGDDLNRCWDRPLFAQQPAVHALKSLLHSLLSVKGNEIKVFCDLHGHSKQFNSFMYACHDPCNETVTHLEKTRLFFKLIGRKCATFSYLQCNFKVGSDKVNTGRVVVWKDLKVANSFTMETSMFGYTSGCVARQFTEQKYFELGEALLSALHEFLDKPSTCKFYDCNKGIEKETGCNLVPEKLKKLKYATKKGQAHSELRSPYRLNTEPKVSQKNSMQTLNSQNAEELKNVSELKSKELVRGQGVAQENSCDESKCAERRMSRNASKLAIFTSKKTTTRDLEQPQIPLRQTVLRLASIAKAKSDPQPPISTSRRRILEAKALDNKRCFQKNGNMIVRKRFKAGTSETVESSMVLLNVKPIAESILASGFALRSLQASRLRGHSRNGQHRTVAQRRLLRAVEDRGETSNANNEFMPNKRECIKSYRIKSNIKLINKTKEIIRDGTIEQPSLCRDKMISKNDARFLKEAKGVGSRNLPKSASEFSIEFRRKNISTNRIK